MNTSEIITLRPEEINNHFNEQLGHSFILISQLFICSFFYMFLLNNL